MGCLLWVLSRKLNIRWENWTSHGQKLPQWMWLNDWLHVPIVHMIATWHEFRLVEWDRVMETYVSLHHKNVTAVLQMMCDMIARNWDPLYISWWHILWINSLGQTSAHDRFTPTKTSYAYCQIHHYDKSAKQRLTKMHFKTIFVESLPFHLALIC